jgi:hypothetical protein
MKTALKSASTALSGLSESRPAAIAVPTTTGATDAASVLGRAAMIQTAAAGSR